MKSPGRAVWTLMAAVTAALAAPPAAAQDDPGTRS